MHIEEEEVKHLKPSKRSSLINNTREINSDLLVIIFTAFSPLYLCINIDFIVVFVEGVIIIINIMK